MLMTPKKRAQSLVDRARRGDRRAFDELIRDHQPRLERLVEARLGNQLRGALDVEDVLQEALLRAFRSLPGFKWRREDAFFSWMAGIVENVIRTAAQKHGRGEFIELDGDPIADQSSPSKGVFREERFDRLEEALGALTPDHREVILLARIERLRIREIAERMNRSPDAVKQLLVRALRRLRESFGDTESLHLPPRRLGGGDEGGARGEDEGGARGEDDDE